MPLFTINLFCNDNYTSEVQTTDRNGKPLMVKITPSQFLAGWTSKPPPFSNNSVTFRHKTELEPGQLYDSPAWANNDLKGIDSQGRPTLIERNGRSFPDSNPPATEERKTVRYLNVSLSKSVERQRPKEDDPF